MGLRDWIRELRNEPLIEALRENVAVLQANQARLEGLIDVGMVSADPDARLHGDQNSRFWRDLGSLGDRGTQGRDFDAYKRQDMLRLSRLQYRLRGDAQNVVQIALDFIMAESGLRPVADEVQDTTLQEALDEIWNDDTNDLASRQHAMVEQLHVDGERFMPVDLNDDGSFELGFIPPEHVKAVTKDKLGRDNWIEVQHPDPGMDPLRYFVLDYAHEDIRVARTGLTQDNQRIRVTDLRAQEWDDCHGVMFAWFINRPDGSTRGLPDLAVLADYLDVHDEHLWTTMDRERLLKMLLINVKSKNATDKAKKKQLLKDLGLEAAPIEPRVLCTDDETTVEILSPESLAVASETLERVLRLNIYGAKAFPEHWSGSAADSNYATAAAQEALPYRRLRRRQGEIAQMFTRMLRFLLRQRDVENANEFHFELPEIGGKDAKQVAEVASKTVESVVKALAENLITRELANKLIVQALRDADFEITDQDAELPDEELVSPQMEKMIAALRDRADGNNPPAGPAGAPQPPGAERTMSGIA